MDSTDFNKIAGGAIGAFLLFLLLHFAAGKIYDTRPTHAHQEPLAFPCAYWAVYGPDFLALIMVPFWTQTGRFSFFYFRSSGQWVQINGC